MMTVSVDKKELDNLFKSLDNISNNAEKQLEIIAWKVAKRTKSKIAKMVVAEIKTTQKVVKRYIKLTKNGTSATVDFSKSERIPLRDFKPTKRSGGIAYTISKKEGRKIAKTAFQVERFGGRVYWRVHINRLPLAQLHGPSPWGVFVKNKMQGPTVDSIRADIRKEATERLRVLNLRKSGTI